MVRRQESTDAAARLRQPTEMDQEKDRREQKICIIYIYDNDNNIHDDIYIQLDFIKRFDTISNYTGTYNIV